MGFGCGFELFRFFPDLGCLWLVAGVSGGRILGEVSDVVAFSCSSGSIFATSSCISLVMWLFSMKVW